MSTELSAVDTYLILHKALHSRFKMTANSKVRILYTSPGTDCATIIYFTSLLVLFFVRAKTRYETRADTFGSRQNGIRFFLDTSS